MLVANGLKPQRKLPKKLLRRHKQAYQKLQAVADVKFTKPTIVKAQLIGKRLGVSVHTVLNYINGQCTDGFLTEAITEELELL